MSWKIHGEELTLEAEVIDNNVIFASYPLYHCNIPLTSMQYIRISLQHTLYVTATSLQHTPYIPATHDSYHCNILHRPHDNELPCPPMTRFNILEIHEASHYNMQYGEANHHGGDDDF